MNHGLTEDVVSKISSILGHYPEIEKAVLYGSRAKGNYKTGSDIDLTLYGDKLSGKILASINNELDDTLLPYTFDISIYCQIENPDLREHIDRVGQVFYERL